ncbi:hypothetical protein [Sphingomonas sp. KR3-1]|uniref:hypothetical protein n=1 Tax=Sphingomonas sp. KR3-1 TaxID=3156611 RepID=UPI0032B32D3B
MELIGIDLGGIVELGTRVALHGTLSIAGTVGDDDLFELVVGIAILIYEIAPGVR